MSWRQLLDFRWLKCWWFGHAAIETKGPRYGYICLRCDQLIFRHVMSGRWEVLR